MGNAVVYEPLTMLGALSAVTEKIGLVATASTTYHQPFHIARMIGSLDHLSKGRIGWNVVTSQGESEAAAFGLDAQLDANFRYERASEFVDLVFDLWNSWEGDAFLRDKTSTRYSTLRKRIPSTIAGGTSRCAAHSTCQGRRRAGR